MFVKGKEERERLWEFVISRCKLLYMGFPGSSVVKNPSPTQDTQETQV